MVQALHAQFPPPASSFTPPPHMAMIVDESPSPSHTCATSLDTSFALWTDSHLPPDPQELLALWKLWTDRALHNQVPSKGLWTFIQMVRSSLPGVGQEK